MDLFKNEFIDEDEISVQNDGTNSNDNIQVDGFSENTSNLSTICIQNDILNECSGFATNEIEIIQQCDNIALRNALILNRKKKYLLLKTLNRLKMHKDNIQNQRIQCKSSTVKDSEWNKKQSTFRLGMPYFKDNQMYPSPFNDDYYKMKNNNEIPQLSYLLPRTWSPIDKCKLALAVYKSICNEKEKDVKNHIETLRDHNIDGDEDGVLDKLIKELNYLNNKQLIYNIATKWNVAKLLTNEEVTERKDELRTNIAQYQSQIVKSSNASYNAELRLSVKKLEEELNEIDNKNYIISTVATWNKHIDWLYISCNEVHRHNDVGCRFMWNSYLSPVNDKKPWTDEQNNMLVQVVKKYKMQDWEQIAKEVDLNKSPYQCCIHFFSKIWDKCRGSKWSKEESILLKSLIGMFQIRDHIPWSKISKYFPERTKIQMYKHYVSVLMCETRKKGAFTLAEDILLCSLLRHYNSMTKASYYFPNRTLIQIRDRYTSMNNNFRDWTFEDDVNILKHVEKFGEVHWKIANVDRRTDLIRHRYAILKKWIIEHPGQNIKNVKRRKKSTAAQVKYQENKYILEQVVNQLLEEVNGGGPPELVFNMDHIENLLTQIGYNNQQTKVKVVKSGRKPTREEDFNYIMCEFFKYYFSFKGRQKSLADFDCARGAERIKVICDSLGANLNIPDVSTLQENPLLDELDIKILTELSTENDINTEPVASTSQIKTFNSTQVFNSSSGSGSKVCNTSLPPDPETLIGFRGIMLHVPQLKKHACNYYHSINIHLPDNACYDLNLPGINNTAKMMSNQIKSLDKKKQKLVISERELFAKRFKSMFKWPAIMSLPSNTPPENVFSDVVENQPKIIKQPIVKKRGRPLRVNAKVQRMLEGKKRKINALEEENSTDKKQKVD